MQLHQRVFVSQFPCLVEEYLVYFVFNSSLLVINILHTVLVSFSANHRESELAWTFTWPEMSLVAAETVKWTKLIVSLGWVCVVAVRPSALLNCRQLLQILKSKSKHRDYLLATSAEYDQEWLREEEGDGQISGMTAEIASIRIEEVCLHVVIRCSFFWMMMAVWDFHGNFYSEIKKLWKWKLGDIFYIKILNCIQSLLFSVKSLNIKIGNSADTRWILTSDFNAKCITCLRQAASLFP